jgi:hypothetical protein
VSGCRLAGFVGVSGGILLDPPRSREHFFFYTFFVFGVYRWAVSGSWYCTHASGWGT